MQNETGPMTDRPASRLENLANNLSSTINALDRAILQYDNMLIRLRGVTPETADKKEGISDAAEPATMQRLDILSETLALSSSKLNNQADELQEYL